MQTDADRPAHPPSGISFALGKRFMDLVIASCALLVLAPLLLLLALLVRLQMGRPVLFRQERPGFRGRPFVMYKFRSMNQARGADGQLLPDEERLNRFGRLLRLSSLDELPELLNVLRGDMSLVGPRPFLMEEFQLFTADQARRHDVPPGITGWAQINGRHLIPYSKRIELDLWYVEHQSLWLDLRILLLTVPRMLFSRSVLATERNEDAVDIGRKDDR